MHHDAKVKLIHKTAEQGRLVMVTLHRLVGDAQESQYMLELTKARRLECATKEVTAVKERAKAAAEAQARVQAASATTKLTIQQVREAAMVNEEELDWSSDPEEVDLA